MWLESVVPEGINWSKENATGKVGEGQIVETIL